MIFNEVLAVGGKQRLERHIVQHIMRNDYNFFASDERLYRCDEKIVKVASYGLVFFQRPEIRNRGPQNLDFSEQLVARYRNFMRTNMLSIHYPQISLLGRHQILDQSLLRIEDLCTSFNLSGSTDIKVACSEFVVRILSRITR